MNTLLATGYIHRSAVRACTPAGIYKLTFEAMLRADGDEEVTPWHCEIEHPDLVNKLEDRLSAGRGIVLRAQLAGRPFMRNGVRSGFVRFLKVSDVELVRADRTGPATETEQEANT